VDRAREHVPLRALLRFLRVSPSRFHAWSRRKRACVLEDQSSCPRISPSRLTPSEVRVIKDLVTSPEYRYVPTGTLAVLAQRLGKVWASPSTWHRLVRRNGWRRPRLRCTRRSHRWAFARLELTKCGTTTRPSSACSTGLAPISMRHRQLLTWHFGVAGRGYVCAGEQCGGAG
jgi:hypothetical protein